MCVSGEGGVRVWVGGCDCVDVGVIVWVHVGVIAWVRKGVCGCDGLDCCLKVCVRRGGGEGEGECVCGGRRGGDCVGVGVIVWVGVGVIAWVRKGMCEWDSLDCCLKACTVMYVCVGGGGKRGRGECVCVGGWV